MADHINHFENTPDGGFILVGTVRSNNVSGLQKTGLDSDMWVVKVNSKGQVIWQRALGGTFSEEGLDIKVTRDGGYLACGFSDSPDRTNGNKDMYLVRLDALGQVLWEAHYGGKGNEVARSLWVTGNGGAVLAGETGSENNLHRKHTGGIDGWVVGVNPKGELLWERNIGGSDNEHFVAIAPAAGGWMLLGQTDSKDFDVPENRGATDYYLVKVDGEGEPLWKKVLGGSKHDIPHSLIPTLDGHYLMAGTTFSTDGDIKDNKGEGDVWIVKINANGGIVWSRTYGGSGDEGANGISATFKGHYLVAATSRSEDGDLTGRAGLYDGWVFKIDANGTLIWQKSIGGYQKDEFTAVHELPSGDYLAVGNTGSKDGALAELDPHGSDDGWMVCLRDPIDPPKAISLTPTTLIGYIRDTETQKFVEAEVRLVNDLTNTSLSNAKSDTAFGIYQLILPDTSEMSIGVFAKGYMLISQKVKIPAANRYSEMRLDFDLQPLKKGVKVNLYNIYFDPGSANIKSESFPELERVVEFCKQNPNVRLAIKGHTDGSGAPDTKLKLSTMRANSVKDWLISKGVQAPRLTSQGFGMSQPIASDDTEDGRAQNRRVEFEIL